MKICAILLIVVCLYQTTLVKPVSAQPLDQTTIGLKLEFWANKYNIPPVLLKAIAWQESSWRQFDSKGDPLLGFDEIGIGIMQISNYNRDPQTQTPAEKDYIEKLKTDYEFNISEGARMLCQKWRATPRIGNGDRNILENWYFAVWAYNGWKSRNNPNSPNVTSTGAYQDKVFNLMGQTYNTSISFAPGASKIPKEKLPLVDPPSLHSIWSTPTITHKGDLKVDLTQLTSTGSEESVDLATGDFWLNYFDKPLGAYYALPFYVTAYNSPLVQDKTALVLKLKTAYDTLLTKADALSVSNPTSPTTTADASKTIAAKYYWTVLQGPDLDNNLTATRAKAGLLNTKVNRLYGMRAEDTAIRISQEGWRDNSAQYVLLARVEGFQDALAAAPLAKKLDAPLLLTKSNQIDSEVLTEIKRVGAKKVLIIGGEMAVSKAVYASLEIANMGPERIFGQEAPDTAAEIARRMGPSTQVIVASSDSFADALSVSAPAAALGIPILLTDEATLPEATKRILQDFGVTKTIIVGGSAVVSTSMDTGNGPLMKYGPIRLAGLTQYDTMLEIVNYFQQDTTRVVLTTGENFPDGLAGGAFAALTGSPLILVGKHSVDPKVLNYLSRIQSQTTKLYILGGTGAVSANSESNIRNTLVNSFN